MRIMSMCGYKPAQFPSGGSLKSSLTTMNHRMSHKNCCAFFCEGGAFLVLWVKCVVEAHGTGGRRAVK